MIRGMIFNINLMQNYSENSVTANNRHRRGCKEYISHTGKFYVKWLRRKRQLQHER